MRAANRKIVEYIRDQWIIPCENNSQFALDHNLDEKTVRRIRDDEKYQISLITIMRICFAKHLTLYEFFKEVDI